MSSESTRQSVVFQDVFGKPVVAKFDTEGQSSDGGVILLKRLDEGIGLSESLIQHFEDTRRQDRVRHPYADLFRQRVYGIALGYSD